MVGVIGIFLSAGCRKESAPVAVNEPPAFVAGAESWVTASAITKRKYQVSVALPPSYATGDQAYPVLYATDANYHFGTLVETARLLSMDRELPEVIVVGIGWPVGYGINTIAPRALDLTPTADPAWVETATRDFPKNGFPPPEGSGGGAGFLRFIREELIPSVEKKYRANPADRTYYGFSFGGLFGAYALLNNEGTFRRFVVGSPALWWNNRAMFEQEKAYAGTHKSLAARVFFSIGVDEDSEFPHSVSDLRQFARVLTERRYEGLTVDTHYFEGERHNSVGGATISRGLRFIYAKE